MNFTALLKRRPERGTLYVETHAGTLCRAARVPRREEEASPLCLGGPARFRSGSHPPGGAAGPPRRRRRAALAPAAAGAAALRRGPRRPRPRLGGQPRTASAGTRRASPGPDKNRFFGGRGNLRSNPKGSIAA